MVTYSASLVREFVLSVECCDIARYPRSSNDRAADVPYSHTSLQEVSCEIFTSFRSLESCSLSGPSNGAMPRSRMPDLKTGRQAIRIHGSPTTRFSGPPSHSQRTPIPVPRPPQGLASSLTHFSCGPASHPGRRQRDSPSIHGSVHFTDGTNSPPCRETIFLSA